MTFRDDMNEIADDLRSLMGPDDFDVCPTSVEVLVIQWAGGNIGAEPRTVLSTLPLDPYTLVRHLRTDEIPGPTGRYERGDVVIGPITPQYQSSDGSTRGFTEAQLNPDTPDMGTELVYVLAQQSGATGINGHYTVKELRRDRSHRFEVIATRKFVTP